MSTVAIGTIAAGALAAGGSAYAGHEQAQGAKNAIQLQEEEFNQQQKNEQPFLQAGQESVNNLAKLANDPNFSKYPGGPFTAPTLEQAEQAPGYKFQLDQGTQAINENAAANGTLLTGNTGKALVDYGQGLAQSDYNNVYNQALETYGTNFNTWNTDTTNQFNRLGTLANIGTNAAANLGTEGQAAAQNEGNAAQNEATANASGIAGATNAIGGAISNVSMLPLYSQMYSSMYPTSHPTTNSGDPFGAIG